MSVLCYHGVDDAWESPLAMHTSAFAAHVEWLARSRNVLPLPEAVTRLDRRGRLPRGCTALTFDDGFLELRDRAWPVLQRYRLPWTIFLVAQTLTVAGQPVDWVDTAPPWPLRTLERDDVLELRDAGVHFGSHSWAHLDLTTLSEAECVRDLRDSRELLEELLGEPVDHLVYPRGRHAEHVRRAAKRAGYRVAFALPEQREEVGPFSLPRAGLFRGNGVGALRIKSARSYVQLRTHPVYTRGKRLATNVVGRVGSVRRTGPGGRTSGGRP